MTCAVPAGDRPARPSARPLLGDDDHQVLMLGVVHTSTWSAMRLILPSLWPPSGVTKKRQIASHVQCLPDPRRCRSSMPVPT